MVKSLECPKGIPPMEPVECPQETIEETRRRAQQAIQQALTVDEFCPVCGCFGTRVTTFAKKSKTVKGVCRIVAFEISITRPCGHAKRDFAIGI